VLCVCVRDGYREGERKKEKIQCVSLWRVGVVVKQARQRGRAGAQEAR